MWIKINVVSSNSTQDVQCSGRRTSNHPLKWTEHHDLIQYFQVFWIWNIKPNPRQYEYRDRKYFILLYRVLDASFTLSYFIFMFVCFTYFGLHTKHFFKDLIKEYTAIIEHKHFQRFRASYGKVVVKLLQHKQNVIGFVPLTRFYIELSFCDESYFLNRERHQQWSYGRLLEIILWHAFQLPYRVNPMEIRSSFSSLSANA